MSASVKKLDKLLGEVYSGYGEPNVLNSHLQAVSSRNVPWEKIRHLRIVCDTDNSLLKHFLNAGIHQGCYLNRNGDLLLMILLDEPPLSDYLIHCSKSLASLFIWNSQMSILNLQGCPNLKKLNLRDAPMLSCVEFSFPVPSLEYLSMQACHALAFLPVLADFTTLTSLNLSGCGRLIELPGLENLTKLSSLNLFGCTSLTELPGLENLTKLSTLNLSGCTGLSALPDIGKLTQLVTLGLATCSSLSQLPAGLPNCTKLRSLDLSGLNLVDLPDWFPDIAAHFTTYPLATFGTSKAYVTLYNTKVDAIPDMSIFEQPYEVVAEFFRNRTLGKTHPLNEIKVVFLGDGEAGKSHTIARLMNDGGEPDFAVFDGQSTPGIVIRNKEYTVGERTFTIHYWDFGGQEIMHSMHRIFLTGRTMYVVLLNARDDTQSDRAKYWLHNVKSFAPDAPVLLVLNKIDQNENASVDMPDLRGRHDKLTELVRLSARDFSREEFNDSFTRVLLEQIEKTGFLDAQWPVSWTRVKDKLENMTTHYITGDDYQDICAECEVDRNQKELLHWFNDLGVSFCYDNDEEDYALEDYVILRPDWITNALYIILFNRLEGAKNGLIPHKSIYQLLKNAHKYPNIRCTLRDARYTAGDIHYVLGIMRKFNLSFPDGADHEFIPMLCQQNSTVDVQYYRRDAEVLEFNMEFDYLPNNLLHRLMVERHTELDMENVWRTGARFQFWELGYSAVVVIDGETLRFFIRHTDPMHRPNTYLTMLKTHVDRIVAKMGLKPPTYQLVYKLDGKREEFDFGLLKEMLEAGVNGIYSRIQRKQIPIEDILNQAAPDGLEDEEKLLDQIILACGNIQDEPCYHLIPSPDGRGFVNGQGMEDQRNRRIRDNLLNAGYQIFDQTQRGISSTGKRVGELDMLVCNDSNQPWTIIKALRISDKNKSEWNKHLDELISTYNYFGARFMYLLTYVDADIENFTRIWNSYQGHIPTCNPAPYTCARDSFVELNDAQSPQDIKVSKCQYSLGDAPITVYHIFARIPTQDE